MTGPSEGRGAPVVRGGDGRRGCGPWWRGLAALLGLVLAALPARAQQERSAARERVSVEVRGEAADGLDLRLTSVRLGEVIDRLETAGLRIAYSPDRLPLERPLRLVVREASAGQVLRMVAAAVGIRARPVAEHLWVLEPESPTAGASAGRGARARRNPPPAQGIDPVDVEPLRVRVDGGSPALRRAGFYRRRRRARRGGSAHFLDAAEIDARGGRLSSVLASVPGLQIKNLGAEGLRPSALARRRLGPGSVVFFPRHRRMSGPCLPAVYLDGRRVTRSGPARDVVEKLGPRGINSLVSPSSVAGLEVYRSSAAAVGRFEVRDARCGAIVLWTGSG